MHTCAKAIAIAAFLAAAASACACVTASTQRTEPTQPPLPENALLFRGIAIDRTLLPLHPRMGERKRYKVTFRVERVWNGNPGRTLTLYTVDPRPDCYGQNYEIGKTYSITAYTDPAKDVILGDYFQLGWIDVVPQGTPMVSPAYHCEYPEQRIRELGPGRKPKSK